MTNTLTTSPANRSEPLQGGNDHSCNTVDHLPSLTNQPQHRGLGLTTTAAEKGGMNDRKRNSDSLIAEQSEQFASEAAAQTGTVTGNVLPGNGTIKPPPSKRTRRVSFCKTTKPPSDALQNNQSPPLNNIQKLVLANNTNNTMSIKKSTSCGALPQLALPTALLISEAPTGELDLSVSPATFVKTIVLQSKSITGSFRGEDIISDASKRVTQDSYFLTFTHEHLEAYTTDKVNAVQGNDIDTLRTLLKEGHLMQASNRFGESMLHTSCRRGFGSVVEFFVNEANVSPRVKDDMGRTPMHDACWSSSAPNHDIMKLLILAAPEMLLSKDKRGHSPFDYARREYWPNWVQFLNEHRQFIVNSLVESCLESSELLGVVGDRVGGEGGLFLQGGIVDQ